MFSNRNMSSQLIDLYYGESQFKKYYIYQINNLSTAFYGAQKQQMHPLGFKSLQQTEVEFTVWGLEKFTKLDPARQTISVSKIVHYQLIPGMAKKMLSSYGKGKSPRSEKNSERHKPNGWSSS